MRFLRLRAATHRTLGIKDGLRRIPVGQDIQMDTN